MPSHKPLPEGGVYGRLTVFGDEQRVVLDTGEAAYFSTVRCACGKVKQVNQRHLRNGSTTSCGCKGVELRQSGQARRSHGFTGTRTYRAWCAMKQRCSNENVIQFKDWGGRGITYCDQWNRFENFLRDMEECPPRHSLDRINNDGNYEPANCRWVSSLIQAQNQQKTKIVSYEEVEMSFSQACRSLGRSPATVMEFAKKRGLTHQEAVDQYQKARRTKKGA